MKIFFIFGWKEKKEKKRGKEERQKRKEEMILFQNE